jgi:tetratricopeptide (TPR) repeat protein
MRDSRDQKSLWTTLPGFLTGTAGLIAVGGLIGGIAIAGLTPTLASDLNEKGVTSYRRGQYQEALNYYRQALAIHREVGDRAEEGKTLYNIGRVHEVLGQYGQALKSY